MPGISSLLRSAESAAKKVAAAEDAQVAFDWENSAQTYEDFKLYSDYLQKRADKANDASTQLTYLGKIRSAQRSYTSNEIQRQSMAVMEGNASTLDKMRVVNNLYNEAINSGDYNAAQNLHYQLDSLSVQYQNEQESAARAYGAAGTKAINNLIASIKTGHDDVTLPSGEKVTPLAVINDDLKRTGGDNATWSAAAATMSALANIIIDSYNNATTQEQVNDLEEKYGPGLADLNTNLKFKIGGLNLSAQDIMNADANQQINNPIYGLKAEAGPDGTTTYKLKENNVDSLDYVRQNDGQGNEYYVPIEKRTGQDNLFFGQSDQGRGLSTQITNEGSVIGGGKDKGQINMGTGEVKRDESQSIGNRLKALGIEASQNGTTLKIKLPGENIERIATIQPDGSIRYMADGQVKEIGLVDRNLGSNDLPLNIKAGEARVVSPDEVSDFSQASVFGGTLSKTSQQGQNYIDSITGKSAIEQVAPAASVRLAGTAAPLLKGPIRVGNDFSGKGAPTTSSLLGSAMFTNRAVQLQQQQQASLQRQAELALQSTSNQFNLNQTPVQQFANNGVLKRQLQVAPPAALPRVYVAPPAPTPKITSVGVAQPAGSLRVGVSGSLQPF